MADDAIVPEVREGDGRGALPAGLRLRQYEILSVLGHGSFGVTYRARDTALGQEVAIKEYFPAALVYRDSERTVLPRSTDMAEQFVWGRERFLEEERTLERLAGAPAVVRVIECFEANGTAYMVMGLVPGETLDQRLKREGRLLQQPLERLIGPLLDGLERVHAEGYLHRDIKPGNIIVDQEGLPTLIDFGAARAALVGRTQTLTAVFTPGYAPVEQFTSGKQGPCTDIYALGATLYQCVAGAVPPSAIDRVIDDQMKSAVEVGRDTYDARLLVGIDAALVATANERPQTIAEWREIFVTGIAPTSTAATRLIPQTAAARSRRRLRWAGAAAGMALLAVLVGGYFAVRPVAPSAPPPNKVRDVTIAAKSGVEILVTTHANWQGCKSLGLPKVELTIPPANGKVSIRSATERHKECNNPIPAIGVYYTANPGFIGTDHFDFDRKADPFGPPALGGVRHVTVNVSAAGTVTR